MLLRLLGRYWPFMVTVVVALFGLWQMNRADASQRLSEAQAESISTLKSTIASRDGFIQQQNVSIQNLAAARQEGRVIYLQDYARADAQAQSHNDRATELLGLQAEFTDELAECRAAKVLLQKELVK